MDDNILEIQDVEALNIEDKTTLSALQSLNSNIKLILCRIQEDITIQSIEEAYLKLHLISYKFFQPNTLNLDNLFNTLPNVAWTNNGPIELESINHSILESKRAHRSLEIKSIDKFPC